MATMAIRENGQTNRAHKQGALCAVKVIALGHNTTPNKGQQWHNAPSTIRHISFYTSPNTKG